MASRRPGVAVIEKKTHGSNEPTIVSVVGGEPEEPMVKKYGRDYIISPKSSRKLIELSYMDDHNIALSLNLGHIYPVTISTEVLLANFAKYSKMFNNFTAEKNQKFIGTNFTNLRQIYEFVKIDFPKPPNIEYPKELELLSPKDAVKFLAKNEANLVAEEVYAEKLYEKYVN